MPQGRSLVFQAIPQTPSVASLDSKPRTDQGAEFDEASVFEDVEDRVDRWVSVAVFGTLAVAISLWILLYPG